MTLQGDTVQRPKIFIYNVIDSEGFAISSEAINTAAVNIEKSGNPKARFGRVFYFETDNVTARLEAINNGMKELYTIVYSFLPTAVILDLTDSKLFLLWDISQG